MIPIPKIKHLMDLTAAGAMLCPECKSPIFPAGGCLYCPNCGWNSCG